MSRSGYTDDYDYDNMWGHICWRGAVAQATRGKRGQKLLKEMAEAMDEMPVKELVEDTLEAQGQYCALGVVGKARGLELDKIDPYDERSVAGQFDIAPALAREVVYMNDEAHWRQETPAQRWKRMRKWVESKIIKEKPE